MRKTIALLPTGPLLGFSVALVATVLIGWFSYRANVDRVASAAATSRTIEVIRAAEGLLSTLKDAETGQRGYLLTSSERYLAPYNTSRVLVPERIEALEGLLEDDREQHRRVATLRRLAMEKLREIDDTVELKRRGDSVGALKLVLTDHGQNTMEQIRLLGDEIVANENEQLAARRKQWELASNTSFLVAFGGAVILFVLVFSAGILVVRDFRKQRVETWLRAMQSGLATDLQGENDLDSIAQKTLDFVAKALGGQVGTLYVGDASSGFRRAASYALAPDDETPSEIRSGEGLAGQAVRERKVLRVREVPTGYLHVRSTLGGTKPREVVVAPLGVAGVVNSVIELAFLRAPDPREIELLERIGENVGIAVRQARSHERLTELLGETQHQAVRLAEQQDELRASNEELEEQGRALRETHAALEQQQASLEMTNAQLEEQSERLRDQKEELVQAQEALSRRAAELERANRYKSEFLANMSHELRTPLNSSLILAKLLSDNKDGNLSEEQVRFAETISAAGNDLLTLINDILDLAKIESGTTETKREPLAIAHAVEAIVQTVEPLAREKGLALTLSIEPGVPDRIETDDRRFAQILKNLLANAIKFTNQGEVKVGVALGEGERVLVSVRDTGIGIPHDQQEVIFEAFRQADGSTHRKYGGTGLGLSISRELAHLLGGEITVSSTPDVGSTFTLDLPTSFVESSVPIRVPKLAPPVYVPMPSPGPSDAGWTPASLVEDDRALLDDSGRLILVVEDDARFATILRDLARELSFRCIVTGNANDGVEAARRYRPSAIVLDVNLPDHSGLGVLETLKRSPETRHIPVHVVSVVDYSQVAFKLGAVGYALKPVKRQELEEAIHKLEEHATRSPRRLLIVEDDARQADSLRELLSNDQVEVALAARAEEAIELLRTTVFDCMVLDLHLPDMTGYELLERMASLDLPRANGHWPPVIVYTGRDVAGAEEQRLRRFSSSIIIKDARSPERLLDEVTLFLHQVEAKLPSSSQRMLREARNRESAFEQRRILVVEDDVRNIFALTKVLEPRGALVEIARNGREALEVLDKSLAPGTIPFDLVLMDVMMPEMDGLTATRQIRRRPEFEKLPVIALTAKAMRDDRDRCIEAGANDYIAKPLDVERLLSLLRVWMLPR